MSAQFDHRISKASVAGMNDGDLFWALIEPVWPSIEEPDSTANLSRATPGQRALLAITMFVREVCNGGLHQFFWNSEGHLGPEVVAGFERLGSPERAELMWSAMSFFGPAGPPADVKSRRVFLSGIPHAEATAFFDPLERLFYEEEKLPPLFRAYVDRHPQEFFNDVAT
jgi:hypothetical protein